MTEKNRRLIRKIAHSNVWREVVRLPRKLMAEAASLAKAKPNRAASSRSWRSLSLFLFGRLSACRTSPRSVSVST
jgi:hypothetical protein